jgi:uncharacterized protein (DUF1499 family)
MRPKIFFNRVFGAFVRMTVFILICIVVTFVGYVRLAPSSAERFHISISATENKDMKGASIRLVPNTTGAMETLERTLKALPRTSLLAGASADGHVTYVTRSKWMGFPDFTTLEQSDDTIKMFARLRFGRQDMGVNAARLRKLIASLD